MNTHKLSVDLDIKPASIRARLCRFGHYFGLKPQRLPNGRLDWPDDSKDQLLQSTRHPANSDSLREAD